MEVGRVPTCLLLSLQFFSFPPATSRALLVRSEEEEKEGGSSLPFILQLSDFENQVGIMVREGVWPSVASNLPALASVAQV